MDSLFWVALTTGFIGGFGHCSFMCGPIITPIVVQRNQNLNFWIIQLHQILYHFGRIFTYSTMGFLMGYTGSFVQTITPVRNIQYVFLLLIGLYLIIYGIEILSSFRFRFFSLFEGVIYNFFKNKSDFSKESLFSLFSLVSVLKEMNSVWKYFLYGLFLGFLPCGLSYTAFITSAGTMNPFKGFLFMFLFGLANIPALWFVVSFSVFLMGKIRSIVYRIGGIIFLITGIFIVVSSIKKIFNLTSL